MRIKNYLEEVVVELLDLMLKDHTEICKCSKCKADMVAFALNQIPPRYVISELGITSQYISEIFVTDDKTDIITAVNLAIEYISHRSHRSNHRSKGDIKFENNKEEILNYFYIFPVIFGKVIDAETKNPVPDTKVFCYFENELAHSIEPLWKNPYTIKKENLGCYAFWQKAINAEEFASNIFNIMIRVIHPEYKEVTKRLMINIASENLKSFYLKDDYVERVATIQLFRSE